MRNLLSILGLFLLLWPLHAQKESYYYGANGERLQAAESAIQKKEVNKRSDKRYVVRTFRKSGEKWDQVSREKIRVTGDGELQVRRFRKRGPPEKYDRLMRSLRPGSYDFKETRLDLVLREGTSSSFLPLHLEGEVTEYYPNGRLKSKSIYRDNQLISNENWLSDGTRYIDSIFYSADSAPEYKMGNVIFRQHIMRSLWGSEIDLTQIEGQVVIGWVVMENGELNGVILLRGKYRTLNELLVETIYDLPGSWEPAMLNGEPVRYFMSIPLNFLQPDVQFQQLEFSDGYLHYFKH